MQLSPETDPSILETLVHPTRAGCMAVLALQEDFQRHKQAISRRDAEKGQRSLQGELQTWTSTT